MTDASEEAALDDPVGASLRGHHASLARRHGSALTYRPDVASFAAVALPAGASQWSDLAALLGPGALADLFSLAARPPAEWEPVFEVPGLQLVGPDAGPVEEPPLAPGDDLVTLGQADAADMLDLTGRTRPGPFWRHTHLMGRYVGIRSGGRLVAMAGERLRPPGWTEISAVCTAPEARGHGCASRLVRVLAAGIVARGERPFLHVAAENEGALALYRRLGFRVRREVVFHGHRTPPAT